MELLIHRFGPDAWSEAPAARMECERYGGRPVPEASRAAILHKVMPVEPPDP